MAWLELSVRADQEAAESVSELLARYGYNGGVVVEAVPPPDARLDEAGIPDPLESDPAWPVVLRTYLPLDEQTEETRQRIAEALWHLGQLRPVGQLQTQVLEEEDWANAWKRFYSVQQVGERTVIVPSWLEHLPRPGEVVLHLDPGMAFGTGLHPTTRLCLRLLEQYARAGMRMLDLGTGSGILAIAAAKHGAAPVLALDNDPIAVQAAQDNIDRNGVSEQVQARLGSLGAGTDLGNWTNNQASGQTVPEPAEARQTFDLIAANIVADVLVHLAPDLTAALAPGGILISSGIILDRETRVALAYAAQGLQQQQRLVEGEWVALIHTSAKTLTTG